MAISETAAAGMRERDSEYQQEEGHHKQVLERGPSATFPPILEPESRTRETGEEPALCKKIIYVPGTDGQQAVGETPGEIAIGLAREKGHLSPSSSVEYSNKIFSSVWEEVNDAQESKQEEDAECREEHLMLVSRRVVKERFSLYLQEWATGLHWSSLLASIRVFGTSVIWGLVLGAWLEQKTAKEVGVVEVFFATVVCGSLFNLLGGQAILIVGVTGPSVAFVVASSISGEKIGVDFVPWMGWIGLWSSALLMLLAAFDASKLTKYMTFFSWEVLKIFVGFTFLWSGFEQIAQLFNPKMALESALLSLWLATSTFFIAAILEHARHWQVFSRQTCEAIADYGPLIALFLLTVVPQLPKLAQVQLSIVSLPRAGYHIDQISKLGSSVILRDLPF